jgi:hypothetical protein
LVVKQNGEAWSRPFVAIYEPAENGNTAINSVDYFGTGENVGIHVVEKSGKENFIFSNTSNNNELIKDELSVKGTYGVISKQNDDFTLFLGKGKSISISEYTLEVKEQPASASLKKENNQWYISADGNTDFTIKVNKSVKKAILKDDFGNEYIGKYTRKSKLVIFNLPRLSFQKINIFMGY